MGPKGRGKDRPAKSGSSGDAYPAPTTVASTTSSNAARTTSTTAASTSTGTAAATSASTSGRQRNLPYDEIRRFLEDDHSDLSDISSDLIELNANVDGWQGDEEGGDIDENDSDDNDHSRRLVGQGVLGIGDPEGNVDSSVSSVRDVTPDEDDRIRHRFLKDKAICNLEESLNEQHYFSSFSKELYIREQTQ